MWKKLGTPVENFVEKYTYSFISAK